MLTDRERSKNISKEAHTKKSKQKKQKQAKPTIEDSILLKKKMKKTDKKDRNSPVESGGSCCCLGIAHKCSSSSSPSQPSLMTQKKYSIRSVVPIWTLESSLLVERSSDAMRCCLTSCL